MRHDHLDSQQLAALAKIASSGDRYAGAKKTAVFWLAIGVGCLLVLAGLRPRERIAPKEWGCNDCAAQWQGYDYASDHGFRLNSQCRPLAGANQVGCLTFTQSWEDIEALGAAAQAQLDKDLKEAGMK